MFSKSTIKYIQSLQHKKFRDESNAFTAEGPKVVLELLQSKIFKCKAVYGVEEWFSSLDQKTIDLIAGEAQVIKDFELEKIAHYSTANKVVAVFEKKQTNQNPVIKKKLTLVLDDIQDPGNLGTMIRTADWFGIENIICSTHTVDMYNPKLVQSTMASLGRVNVIYTDIAEWLKKNSAVVKIAATLNGKPMHAFENIQEGIVIIGNESKGISEEILQLADEKITIPKVGAAESLNAAVATGILLYTLNPKLQTHHS